MNPSSLEACERAATIDCSKTQETLSLSRDDEASHRHPLLILEDIPEPESWTLANFSDLLPHEMA
jgi:hypothetical protein